jgi:hypothetical protein
MTQLTQAEERRQMNETKQNTTHSAYGKKKLATIMSL